MNSPAPPASFGFTPEFLEAKRGYYAVRPVKTQQDMQSALRLRAQCFRGAPDISDLDEMDPPCLHGIVEDLRDMSVVGAFRILLQGNGQDLCGCYAWRYYDLSSLANYPDRMLELGRFCTAPHVNDADVLRITMAALTRMVDGHGVRLMFGCCSFAGTDPSEYLHVFALLKQNHSAPEIWKPQAKAPNTFRFDDIPERSIPRSPADRKMPKLLKTYLEMGAWVSDHAVIDYDLGTLHVFVGLEVNRIPRKRAQALRAIAQIA